MRPATAFTAFSFKRLQTWPSRESRPELRIDMLTKRNFGRSKSIGTGGSKCKQELVGPGAIQVQDRCSAARQRNELELRTHPAAGDNCKFQIVAVDVDLFGFLLALRL